jgi:Tol biopolymer transport system component
LEPLPSARCQNEVKVRRLWRGTAGGVPAAGRYICLVTSVIGAAASASCSSDDSSSARSTSTSSAPMPARVERRGHTPVSVGEPIDVVDLSGRIVFDDFEDLFTMRPDGTDIVTLTSRAGSEFDGAWSPDGQFVVYRDSRRGINEDDEVYIVRADGTGVRNLTNDPANDWGPDWSGDGEWIVFNSDRDGGALGGYLVRPDGSDLTRLPIDGWVEYATFSPDGSRIAFMRHVGSNYDIFVADVATGETIQLTDASGSDGWPSWSPDGTTIAFSTERDDCLRAPDDQDCWHDDEPGEHHDIWIMDADGGNQRRVTPESGQFVTWSPDGRYLLISGRTLYVVRPDGTGRVELRADGFPLAPGGIPDWTG